MSCKESTELENRPRVEFGRSKTRGNGEGTRKCLILKGLERQESAEP